MIRFASFVLTLCAVVPGAFAVTYPLPSDGGRLVGEPITVTVPQGNTLPLEAFAAQYGQGLSNMLEANPGVNTPLTTQIPLFASKPLLREKPSDTRQLSI